MNSEKKANINFENESKTKGREAIYLSVFHLFNIYSVVKKFTHTQICPVPDQLREPKPSEIPECTSLRSVGYR